MNAATTPIGDAKNNATFHVTERPRTDRSKPELARAWLLSHATGNILRPLARIAAKNIPPWDSKPALEKSGKLRYSRGQRAFFQVLDQLRQSNSECQLSAVTVVFSEEAARRLDKGNRSFASAYGNTINKRLRDSGIPAAWFAVAEDSGRASESNPYAGLHVHLVIAYHIEDKSALKAIFRKDKNDRGNSFMTWKDSHEGGPINGGWPDYMTKDIFRRSKHLPEGTERVYVPRGVRVEGKQQYEPWRQRIDRLDDHREELEGLTLHQCLSFALHGKRPSQYPEPEYDWEYEEGCKESKVLEIREDSEYTAHKTPEHFSKSSQRLSASRKLSDLRGKIQATSYAQAKGWCDDSPPPNAFQSVAEPDLVGCDVEDDFDALIASLDDIEPDSETSTTNQERNCHEIRNSDRHQRHRVANGPAYRSRVCDDQEYVPYILEGRAGRPHHLQRQASATWCNHTDARAWTTWNGPAVIYHCLMAEPPSIGSTGCMLKAIQYRTLYPKPGVLRPP